MRVNRFSPVPVALWSHPTCPHLTPTVIWYLVDGCMGAVVDGVTLSSGRRRSLSCFLNCLRGALTGQLKRLCDCYIWADGLRSPLKRTKKTPKKHLAFVYECCISNVYIDQYCRDCLLRYWLFVQVMSSTCDLSCSRETTILIVSYNAVYFSSGTKVGG